MGLADNLTKYDWENDVPFALNQLKTTLHAMIGTESTAGLITLDENKHHWKLTCVYPEVNDTFGSYTFGQVNTIFTITVNDVDEDTSHLSIKVGQRQAAIYSGNQAYLQAECNSFIKALTYYLEHPKEVEDWHQAKPNSLAQAQTGSNTSIANGWYILFYIVIFGIIIAAVLL